MLQDDVLVTSEVVRLAEWADTRLIDQRVMDDAGRERMRRVCSGSLYDLADGGMDGHVQEASNMVARVWRKDFAHRVVKYINFNFDEAPVDWLTDRFCKSARRVTVVMEPNAVRHRGEVSSFIENSRVDTLT